jgi:hypothetical protein
MGNILESRLPRKTILKHCQRSPAPVPSSSRSSGNAAETGRLDQEQQDRLLTAVRRPHGAATALWGGVA